MGKNKKRENIGPDDNLPEDLGRKVVTSILENEGVKRLKALVRGYSKHAIANYQEEESTLSLLQFACVIGNVQAAEYLLGIGADRHIRWLYTDAALGARALSLKWLPVRVHTEFMNRYNNLCNPKTAIPVQPMYGAQLTILHMAALANQRHTVRFLIEKKHLPVDVRADGTGVPPLLAVATTRCCCLDDYRPGDRKHVCSYPTEGPADELESTPECESLLGMFELLLELGADPAAVDDCGCGVLAAAAAAGYYGLWEFIATEERMHWFDMRAVHASHVLLRAAQFSTAMEPKQSMFFEEVTRYLQQLYTARGVEMAQQLKGPAPVFEYGADHEHSVQPSHPLRAAMEAPEGALVVSRLLDLGVTLDALQAGLKEVPLGRPCPIECVYEALLHEHEQGEHLMRQGKVLMALFYNCCLYTHPAGADKAEVLGRFGRVVAIMTHDHIDFRELFWWPAVPETLMGSCLIAAESSSDPGMPPSPLVFAAAWSCKPAVTALLTWLSELGDTEFINKCSYHVQTPLIAAAAGGHLEICKMLIEAGADILKTARDGNWPLFAAASLAESLESGLILSLLIKRQLEIWKQHRPKIWDLLHQPGPGGMTIIQRLLHSRHDGVVCSLAPMMEPLFCVIPPNPLRTACLRSEAEPNKEELLTQLLESEGSKYVTAALTEHDSEHGLTVLGEAVAWGHDKTVQILASTCKREGLELAPLLERHVDRSPFSTPLFTAIIHHYPDTLRSLAANGLELTPEISAQHLLLSAEALQDGGRLAGREFVRAPRPGQTESISLLMCAASAGNHGALKMLLRRGVDAREEPFPGNRWYRNALTAAIDFPELTGFPGGEELHDGSTSNMGTKQLGCVQELLQARGAMTEKQMYRVLQTIYHFCDTQIGLQLFSRMRKLALCGCCKLVGCWRKCSGCRSTFYCSVDCQTADWVTHREQCKTHMPNLKCTTGAAGELAAAKAAGGDVAAALGRLQLKE